MAKIIDAPDWANLPHTSRTKLPLEQWFNGQAYELTKGVDYTAKTSNFVTSLKKAAKERGHMLRVLKADDMNSVQIQAFNADNTPIEAAPVSEAAVEPATV